MERLENYNPLKAVHTAPVEIREITIGFFSIIDKTVRIDEAGAREVLSVRRVPLWRQRL